MIVFKKFKKTETLEKTNPSASTESKRLGWVS